MFTRDRLASPAIIKQLLLSLLLAHLLHYMTRFLDGIRAIYSTLCRKKCPTLDNRNVMYSQSSRRPATLRKIGRELWIFHVWTHDTIQSDEETGRFFHGHISHPIAWNDVIASTSKEQYRTLINVCSCQVCLVWDHRSRRAKGTLKWAFIIQI